MNNKTLKTIAAATMLSSIITVSASATSIGGASVDASALNLRSDASTASSILTTVPNGSLVVVGDKTNDSWYKVVYRGAVGFMSAQYVSFNEILEGDFGTGTIYGSDVCMRTAPDINSEIVGTYENGTEMNVLGVYEGWYKLSYNGNVGYVYSDCFALNGGMSELYGNYVSSQIESEESSLGQTIVDSAKEYLGVPYVWAGTSPKGFDCSGLVNYVYGQNGYSINRTAASIYNNGVAVDRSELQVGDVICFSSSAGGSYIGHVGIYIGAGEFIHASSSDRCVRIDNLSTSYYDSHYYGARRIV